ncbi:hypothetical protein N7471_002544 [Penicillium samsonianum]|uniref:uncharacterized protein n=1 Tax=Penicillium samsonianum TaxID=1882272 RepID=UPI0025471DFF|nr:uncharacterized protein N7471_002544 [Penicillium samsonianum]KAJ6143091.1 hypothetical protein N7471_002544 [Penicillium samsonianum]
MKRVELYDYGSQVTHAITSLAADAESKKRMMPLLLENSKQTCVALVQLLWPGRGSCRIYKSRGKSYTLCRDTKIISNIENAFLELGWSEQEVKDVEIDHFIDVYK